MIWPSTPAATCSGYPKSYPPPIDSTFVFELAKTANGYADALTTLAGFSAANNNSPNAVSIDGGGNLFGTTSTGGPGGAGTVFEMAYSAGGYGAPATLVGFNGSDGASPSGGVIADANGDLFGTTQSGGADGGGTVFEIAKAADGYAGASHHVGRLQRRRIRPQARPAPLIADANGDLFGTTYLGGADRDGTVFEIAKTADGYASTPTTLVTFNGAYGPVPNRHADRRRQQATCSAASSLPGAVYEIAKTADGYASTPIILITSGYCNSLTADANGNLFGTTSSGGQGSVFEIVFQTTPAILGTVAGQSMAPQQTDTLFSGVAITDPNVGQTEALTVTLSSAVNGSLSNLGGGTYNAATGVYSVSGSAATVTTAIDGLVFTPTAAPGSAVTTSFTITVNDSIFVSNG